MTGSPRIAALLFSTTAYESRNPAAANDRAHLEAFVTDLYNAFLQRPPDAAGHCFWTNDACTMLRKHTISK